MESRRFRGELTAMGFFVLPIGDNWFKPARCFRLSFAAKPSGDILLERTSVAIFSVQSDDTNIWIEKNNELIATDVGAIAINPRVIRLLPACTNWHFSIK